MTLYFYLSQPVFYDFYVYIKLLHNISQMLRTSAVIYMVVSGGTCHPETYFMKLFVQFCEEVYMMGFVGTNSLSKAPHLVN